ncbi:hypothetical protein Tco_0781706 [Tanacetum coccineum]
MNSSHIQYALTENPTIYVSFIKQFWKTTTARTSANGEVELTATIDGQVKTITEASLRRHLKLEDNGGVTTLPNSEIFEQLALMGYVTDSDKLTFQKEEAVPMPHESPLHSVHLLGRDEGEGARIVLSEDEEDVEDSSKQGRKISDIDKDPNISLVQDEGLTWFQNADAEIKEGASEVSTANIAVTIAKVSTAAENLVYIRRSAEKKKDKGKGIMTKPEPEKKTKDSNYEARKTRLKEACMSDPAVLRYHALQNRPYFVAEVRKNMCIYLKNQGGFKMSHFKGMSYEEIRPIYERVVFYRMNTSYRLSDIRTNG